MHLASAAAAPLSDAIHSPHLQSLPESSAGSDLGLEDAFLDFAHSGQSWGACAFHNEDNTKLLDTLPALGVSTSQDWYEGPQGVYCGDDLLPPSYMPGGHI